MALGRRRPAPRTLVHHTDRGCQYTSRAYKKILHDHRLVASMSGKGNCFDRSQLYVRLRDVKLSCCASHYSQELPCAASVKGKGPLGPRRRAPLTEASAAADAADLVEIRALVHQRQTYGYRRAAAMINRRRRSQGRRALNHKRAYRLMRENHLLLQRHTGGPPGRVHDGKVEVEAPNTRWCSDAFEIRTWSGEAATAQLKPSNLQKLLAYTNVSHRRTHLKAMA